MKTLLAYLLTLLTLAEHTYAADFQLPESAYAALIKNKPNSHSSIQPQLSEIAYRQFQPIQKLISTEQYEPALNALNLLAKRYQDKPYVLSVAMKTAAYIYIAQENYPKAALWMTRTLELLAMGAAELQTIRHDLSQLQMHAAEYQNAVTTISDWLNAADNSEIRPIDYQHLAIAEFHLENFSASKLAVQKGLALTKEPSEPLYQLLLASDLALKDYQSARTTLSTLVKIYPKSKNYWQQLAGVYDALGQSKQSLAIYELMAHKKMLNTEAERIQYIQRLIHQHNAFKAANKLSHYIARNEVKKSSDNQLLLADAWERSGENSAALEQLTSLPAKLSYTRLVRLYASEQQWNNVVEVLETQLSSLISPHNEVLYLQLGYALNKLGEFQRAIQIFSKIVTTEEVSQETRTSAQDWLNYLTAS